MKGREKLRPFDFILAQGIPPVDSQLEQDTAQLFALLLNVVLEGERRLAEHLSAQELTAPQFYVLKTLMEHGGRLGIGQIAKQHGLTQATMTGLIHRLEAMRPPLARREVNDEDRRAVYVIITPEGMERFVAVQMSFLAQLRAVFGLLPPDERRRLLVELQYYADFILAAQPS
jgi:DNA-binding MarR family transcriptional regulator